MYLQVIFYSSNYDTHKAHAEKTGQGGLIILQKGMNACCFKIYVGILSDTKM